MRTLIPFVIAIHEEEEVEREESRRVIFNFVKGHLKTIEKRRSTFINWPLKDILPDQLARDGLFYTREGVKCGCVFCSNIFEDWEKLGRSGIEKKHYEISPECQHLLTISKLNEFEKRRNHFHEYPFFNPNVYGCCIIAKRFINHCKPEAVLINNSKDEEFAKYNFGEFEKAGIFPHFQCAAPKYALKIERLNSFRNWPEALTVRQSPEEFAEAGFIFMEMTDHVICFDCNVVICNFENDDEPWVEHAKYSPFCRYLLYIKKKDFVKDVHRRHWMDEKTGIFHKCEKVEEGKDDKNEKMVGGQHPSKEKTIFLNYLNYSLSDYGFPESLETESVTKICKNCLINPVEVVFLPCKHMETCSSCVNKNGVSCPVCGGKINIAFKFSKHEEEGKKKDEAIHQKQKEIEEGKEKCLKCSIQPPEVIFLPCTHMILCALCSFLSANCPLCEEKVEYCFSPIVS